jgi:hypothetical protein
MNTTYTSPIVHLFKTRDCSHVNIHYESKIISEFAKDDSIHVPKKMQNLFKRIEKLLEEKDLTTKEITELLGRSDTTYVNRVLLNMESLSIISGTRSRPRVLSLI